MNLDHLQKKLLAAARTKPPTDRVPLAFEKRVLAHLKARPALDWAALWSRALWRASLPCLALMLILAGLTLLPSGSSTASVANTTTNAATTAASDDLTTAFEQTLLASSDQFTTIDFLEDN